MRRAAARQAEPEPGPEPVLDDVPGPIVGYVRAIGAEKTAELLLAFGGSQIFLPAAPLGRSRLASLIGTASVRALGRELGFGQHVRVPLANNWLARHLHAKGWGTAAIARELRIADSTVRKALRANAADQPRLF